VRESCGHRLTADDQKDEAVFAFKSERRGVKPAATKTAAVTPVGKRRSGRTGTPLPTASSVRRTRRITHLDPAKPLPDATPFVTTPTTRRAAATQTAPTAGPAASLATEPDDVDGAAQQLDTLNRLLDAYRSLANVVAACAARRRVPASANVRLPKAVPARAAFIADDLVAALQRRRAWDVPATDDDHTTAQGQAIAMEMVVLAAQVSEAAAVLQSVLTL
jgi:hypothetical protein